MCTGLFRASLTGAQRTNQVLIQISFTILHLHTYLVTTTIGSKEYVDRSSTKDKSAWRERSLNEDRSRFRCLKTTGTKSDSSATYKIWKIQFRIAQLQEHERIFQAVCSPKLSHLMLTIFSWLHLSSFLLLCASRSYSYLLYSYLRAEMVEAKCSWESFLPSKYELSMNLVHPDVRGHRR